MKLMWLFSVVLCAWLPALAFGADPVASSGSITQIPGNTMSDEEIRAIQAEVVKWMNLRMGVPNLAEDADARKSLALLINKKIREFNDKPGAKKIDKIDAYAGDDLHLALAMRQGIGVDYAVGASLIDGENKYCFPCSRLPGQPEVWGVIPYQKKERDSNTPYYPYLQCFEALQRAGAGGTTRENVDTYPSTTFLPVLSRDEQGNVDGKGFYILTDGRIDRYNATMPGAAPGSKGVQNYMISVGPNKEQNSIVIASNGEMIIDGVKQKSYLLYENPDGKAATNLTKASGPIASDSDPKLDQAALVAVQLELKDKLQRLDISDIPPSARCAAVQKCVLVTDHGVKLPPWKTDSIESLIRAHTDVLCRAAATTAPKATKPAPNVIVN
jgi:hypothetical protein